VLGVEERLAAGARVEGMFGGQGYPDYYDYQGDWYRATVAAANPDGTYRLEYDDGDHEDCVPAHLVRPCATAALEAKDKLSGASRGRTRDVATSAAVGAQLAVDSASDPGPTGPHPREVAWEAQLARLAAYKAEHGDCRVPRGWAEDPSLASWVHSQRTKKKALDRGDPNPGMTAGRAARLETLGFAWEIPDAAWEAQLVRLAAYKAEHGDCRVPRGWAEDPQLGNWVSMQRHLKRKLDRGEPSEGMTAEWVARLTALGFVWSLAQYPEQAAKAVCVGLSRPRCRFVSPFMSTCHFISKLLRDNFGTALSETTMRPDRRSARTATARPRSVYKPRAVVSLSAHCHRHVLSHS
jgi:hypothetical protein